ncbi:MAG: hypothetical protein ACYDCQ_16640, partial [Dehalococcoidia bacterium]
MHHPAPIRTLEQGDEAGTPVVAGSPALSALAQLAMTPAGTATLATLAEAGALISRVLAAEETYVMRSGDPHFTRVGEPGDPLTYELKQKGYYLVWRAVMGQPRLGVRRPDRVL